jgi:hypothetical protein
MYTFLANRKRLIKDSAYKARMKEYNSRECMLFPNLQREDIIALLAYLKTKPSSAIY